VGGKSGEAVIRIASDTERASIFLFYRKMKEAVSSGGFAHNVGHLLKITKMKCSICGRTDAMLLTSITEQTRQSDVTCLICQVRDALRDGGNLSVFDEKIEKLEEMSGRLERLINLAPKIPDVPGGLQQFAFTPLSTYKTVQAILAELKGLRMEALTAEDSETRLKHALEKSLEAEDYERSAEIRDKLRKKGT